MAVTAMPLLSACASARPDFDPPLPHNSLEAASTLDIAPAEPVVLPSRSAVTGDIRFLDGSEAVVDLGRVVVYLVPRTMRTLEDSVAPAPVVVTASSREYTPDLVGVARGQHLVFANEGPVAHRLFSAELGNARFDLPPGTRSSPISLPPSGRFGSTVRYTPTRRSWFSRAASGTWRW